MEATTYSNFRKNLKDYMEQVNDNVNGHEKMSFFGHLKMLVFGPRLHEFTFGK